MPSKFVFFVIVLLGLISPASAADEVAAYNDGVADYRADRWDEAATKFQTAAASADTSLAAKARYNLGNVRFRVATSAIGEGEIEGLAAEVKTLAIENLTAAIDHYRSSLRLNPEDADARANIEKAARLIEKLGAQPPPSEPDSSGGQDGDDDQQGESEDPSESSDQTKPTDQSEPSDESSEKSSDTESKAETESESDEAKGDGEPQAGDGTDPTDATNQTDPSPSNSNSNPEAEAEAEAEAEENPSANADPIEPNNDGELSATNPADDQIADDEMAEPQTQAIPGGGITEQEARKMLQAIRDRDMLRRMQRQSELRNRRLPVDRDW